MVQPEGFQSRLVALAFPRVALLRAPFLSQIWEGKGLGDREEWAITSIRRVDRTGKAVL
jgi:hypothetical protein